MNHINYKIGVLLHEGFSMKTLENFNNKQIDLLYEKVKGKTKEVGEQLDMVVKKDKLADPKTIEAMKKVTPGTKVTIETEVTEKALSKKQQEFFGIVRGMQKGDIPKKGKAGKVSKDIDPKDAKDFASTKHNNLPDKKRKNKKSEVKKLEENILNLVQNHLPPHTTKEELLRVIKSYKR